VRAFGQVAQVHGIPPFSARVVQSRTVRLINGVALDECHRSGALPDARTIFEPLNAKKLERPAALNEPDIDYTPQCSGILTWWSHVLVQKRGGELVEETNQGFENFQPTTRMDTFLEEYRTDGMDEVCAFCNREVPTRGHHVVPRCKGGRDIAPTCHSCEDFIHKTWTHNELRDTFNTVQKIRSDPRFRKFLRWLYKQQEGAFFRTRRNRNRTSQPYR
jgi:hypothetical protein